MQNIKKCFSKIYIKQVDCTKGKRYFDPIRKTFVAITPEETVRQKMIVYLQNTLRVPSQNIRVEEHLVHYNVQNHNGRMDIVIQCWNENNNPEVLSVIECKGQNIFIESMQVREQAENYSKSVNARYYGLINGINIQFFHLKDNGRYVPIQEIPTFEEMKNNVYTEMATPPQFQRLNYTDYFDYDFLNSQTWFTSKIGEDTPQKLIPCIIALDDCLLDFSQKLTEIASSRFAIIEDLGVQYRQYNDMSNGGFGSGEYRIFMVKDILLQQQFLCGFTITTTGKTINDPKYGTTTGKSVLVLMYNDGNVDEMSAQINLNKFLVVDSDKRIMKLIHNGAVSRKGAKIPDLLDYIKQYNSTLVNNNQIEFGEINYSIPLSFQNSDIKQLFTNLIEYCVFREGYKTSLSKKKK